MSTELDFDISALVGEMEDLACEHYQHGKPGFAHDDGAATHYMEGSCQTCGYQSQVRAVCSKYVAHVRAGGRMKCQNCGVSGSARDFIRILGPVNQ